MKQKENENQIQGFEPELTAEGRANLIGFFALLLKIDQRINPENYEGSKKA